MITRKRTESGTNENTVSQGEYCPYKRSSNLSEFEMNDKSINNCFD